MLTATYGAAKKFGDLRLITICPTCRNSRGRPTSFLGSVPAASKLQEAMGILTLRCEQGHQFQAYKDEMTRTL